MGVARCSWYGTRSCASGVACPINLNREYTPIDTNKTVIDSTSIGDQTFIGRATPDRAGARPYRLQGALPPSDLSPFLVTPATSHLPIDHFSICYSPLFWQHG